MSVRLEPIEKFTKIVIDRSPSPMLLPETQRCIDDAWCDLCANNSKYHNGPILVFEGYDAQAGEISARVGEYKHHAVRATIDVGISLLAVTAAICKPDQYDNVPTHLLGKRSAHSHMYDGLWEFGPSGGIEPPRKQNTIGLKGLLKQVDREVREEVGLRILKQPAAPVTIVHDDVAGSSDIHVGIVLDDEHKLNPNWEYDETRWASLDEILTWDEQSPGEIIETTIAHARYLHQNRL
jgi:hypothetical protein